MTNTIQSTAQIDRLWYTRCPAPTPFGVAIQQGWLQDEFRDERLDVTALQDSPDPAVRRSHYTHSQPNSFRQGGNIPALWARAQGAQTRVIGISWVDEFQGLIALPESGIATAADLRGRRFGLPRKLNAEVVDFHRATALRGLTSLLDAAGLVLEDVELVELPNAARSLADAPPAQQGTATQRLLASHSQEFSREALALVRGEVDIVFVKGASGLEAANLIGASVVIDLDAQPNRLAHANNGTPRPLTVDAGLLQARPDLVARVLARTIEAGRWALTHPEETVAYIGRETRCADRWVRAAYRGGLQQQLEIGLHEEAIEALDDFKRFLLRNSFIAHDFDLHAWIDPAPLAAALELLAQRRTKLAA